MNPLDHIMGVEEAAEMWDLSPGYIKNLCAEGKVKAKKIGKTWVLDKTQPNPKGRSFRLLKRELLQNGLLKVTGDMEAVQRYIEGTLPPSLNRDFMEELDEEGWILVDLFDDEAYFEKPKK